MKDHVPIYDEKHNISPSENDDLYTTSFETDIPSDEPDIDNYLLDSSNDSIELPVQRKISYNDNDNEKKVTSHCKMPTGEILYNVHKVWISFNDAVEKCGTICLNKYLKEQGINQVYGTAARARNQKNIDVMMEKYNKRKRSQIRSFINRSVKTKSTMKTKIISDKSINHVPVIKKAIDIKVI